ncbi:hypothetical protein CVM73_34425 [Bradyrhizobium forestalis]|uniref:Uncharacterized protein n=1 Tax=Bradyrhizobium forestalis TaxID=1419263 RepID=A0A2M8QZ06_9BRAD|nr:hypothetical protein CVM73_34425 [Bradyrhizobium forestalis]
MVNHRVDGKTEASTTTAVIPRESGESSTPRLLRITSPSLEYWIARSSRAMTVEGAARRFPAPPLLHSQ